MYNKKQPRSNIQYWDVFLPCGGSLGRSQLLRSPPTQETMLASDKLQDRRWSYDSDSCNPFRSKYVEIKLSWDHKIRGMRNRLSGTSPLLSYIDLRRRAKRKRSCLPLSRISYSAARQARFPPYNDHPYCSARSTTNGVGSRLADGPHHAPATNPCLYSVELCPAQPRPHLADRVFRGPGFLVEPLYERQEYMSLHTSTKLSNEGSRNNVASLLAAEPYRSTCEERDSQWSRESSYLQRDRYQRPAILDETCSPSQMVPPTRRRRNKRSDLSNWSRATFEVVSVFIETDDTRQHTAVAMRMLVVKAR
ncbi:hypothetical protein K438DRAFT_323230 [Mycena galopus ATCC 62051]|nr:hypothetical protein K438DRAFT_323230 [Mycena galopus ATCC 62051]